MATWIKTLHQPTPTKSKWSVYLSVSRIWTSSIEDSMSTVSKDIARLSAKKACVHSSNMGRSIYLIKTCKNPIHYRCFPCSCPQHTACSQCYGCLICDMRNYNTDSHTTVHGPSKLCMENLCDFPGPILFMAVCKYTTLSFITYIFKHFFNKLMSREAPRGPGPGT